MKNRKVGKYKNLLVHDILDLKI